MTTMSKEADITFANKLKPLGDVLYELALAMPKPDAITLEDFIRTYPQHADELTEFAVWLALDGENGEENDDD